MKELLMVLILLPAITACDHKKHYEPEGLRKLSDTEIIERARARNFIGDPEKIDYRDSLGKNISLLELGRVDIQD